MLSAPIKLSILEEDLTFPICHDIFRDSVVLYCRSCLEETWRPGGSWGYPICRQRSSWAQPPANLALRNAAETMLRESAVWVQLFYPWKGSYHIQINDCHIACWYTWCCTIVFLHDTKAHLIVSHRETHGPVEGTREQQTTEGPGSWCTNALMPVPWLQGHMVRVCSLHSQSMGNFCLEAQTIPSALWQKLQVRGERSS